MEIKDYYKILLIEPNASIATIKKAYRKLALQYHPDKNTNLYDAAMFNEIKEAYEVLTNPLKKEAYLQQRWYNKATGKNATAIIVTPITILKQALAYEQQVAQFDVFRMDTTSVYLSMQTFINESIVHTLLTFNEPQINHQIITTVLKPMALLSAKEAEQIATNLLLLSNGNTSSQKLIKTTLHKLVIKQRVQKYQWLSILLLTLFICGIIWYGAH